MEPTEIARWMLFPRDDEPSIIVLVVDDSSDNEMASIFARENRVPSPNFGGVWGSGQKDGYWLVAFHLVELGGSIERQWYTSHIHSQLLEAVLDVPHLVAILPEEIAGEATTAEEIVPRFGGALILEVEARSAQVAEILAERCNG